MDIVIIAFLIGVTLVILITSMTKHLHDTPSTFKLIKKVIIEICKNHPEISFKSAKMLIILGNSLHNKGSILHAIEFSDFDVQEKEFILRILLKDPMLPKRIRILCVLKKMKMTRLHLYIDDSFQDSFKKTLSINIIDELISNKSLWNIYFESEEQLSKISEKIFFA